MKNFLLGFLTACGLTLAALCAAILWCFAEYEEHRREKRDYGSWTYTDYTGRSLRRDRKEYGSETYTDYTKESRPVSTIRMSEKEYKFWKKEAEAANAKSDCADRD